MLPEEFPHLFVDSKMQKQAKVYTKDGFGFRLTNLSVNYLISHILITRIEGTPNFSLLNLDVQDYTSMSLGQHSL